MTRARERARTRGRPTAMDNAILPAGRRLRRGPALLAAPILATLVLSGCGSGGATSGSAGSAGGDSAQLGNTGNSFDAPAAASRQADSVAGPRESGADVEQRDVISTGHIVLSSSDVAATRLRLDAALRDVAGRVADENTTTDDHGTVTRTHLVVRVPSGRFDDAMTSLADTASLRSSSRKAEDVTTQVIDLGARIAADRAGVHRLRRLVSTTADLRALLAVERELSARQGDLRSLRQQRAYLSDQARESTITVDVTRRTAAAPAPEKATGGFVGGLSHGWHALVAVVTGLLLAFGATLPFAVALVLLGVPAWLVVRRSRRWRSRRAPAES